MGLIRKTITERDELLEQTAGNKATVELSNAVRMQLKEVRKDAENLDKLQKTAARKAKKKSKKKDGLSEEEQEYIEHQAEVVELTFKHIEECERLEKKIHFGDNVVDDSSGVVTSLPEIDDDGEVGQKFAQIKMRDEQIDQGLTEVGEGVEVLKQMALEMSDAVDVTGAIMDEVETRVDDNMARVTHLNKRLKSTLESVRSGNRFILDFICCLILLSLVGVGFNLVSSLL